MIFADGITPLTLYPDWDWSDARSKEMWANRGVLEYEKVQEARRHMHRWFDYDFAELTWADDGGAFA